MAGGGGEHDLRGCIGEWSFVSSFYRKQGFMMRSIKTNKIALLCAGTTACGGVLRAYAVLIICGGG